VRALADSIPDVEMRMESPVESISRADEAFDVAHANGMLRADAIVLAVPASVAARLLADLASGSATPLASIAHAPSAVILLRFPHASLGRPLPASGYLAAADHSGIVAACSFLPSKWPYLRTSSGTWLRAVVTDPRALALPDEGLKHRVALEVGRAVSAHGGADEIRLRRWPEALPIYGPSHRRAVRSAHDALPQRIALAGAYVDGVGVPDCVRTGEQAARAVCRQLADR
jgi:oxygen-dependent protoporphyrinogen oxidase